MGYPIQRGNSTKPLTFLLVLSSDHITGATGITPTVTIRKNGGSYAPPVGAITEVANGMYEVAPNPIDANTLGPLALHATGPGCDPRDDIFDVVEYNPAIVQPYSPPTVAAFGTTTAQKLIARALRILGVLAAGDTPDAGDANDAFRTLNGMMSSWATQRQTVFVVERRVFPLVSDQASYTIGIGADFDIVRPNWIEGVSVVYDNEQPTENEVQLPPPYNEQQWQGVSNKTETSTQPTRTYFKPSFPFATLFVWPIFAGGGTLHIALYIPTPLNGFADLFTQYAFPDGYEDAIVFNLVQRLAPEYGVRLDPDVKQLAIDNLANIKRLNSNRKVLTFNRELLNINGRATGRWDIRTG